MAETGGVTIIKRKKVVAGGGHHGGAWKVAYADFVTAMMAFFLLMWLLNATTEEQRKGLADYFSPSIPVHKTSGGGDGPFGGSSVTAEMTMAQNGTGATKERPSSQDQSRGATGTRDKEDRALEEVVQALQSLGGESDVANELLEHVRTKLTDKGLVIEIFELPDSPLFTGEDDQPTEKFVALMDMIAKVSGMVTNDMALTSHLSVEPLKDLSYNGWQRSADRSLTARSVLLRAGVVAERFSEVTGKADKYPAEEDPFDVRNRRLEVTLLRSDRAQNSG